LLAVIAVAVGTAAYLYLHRQGEAPAPVPEVALPRPAQTPAAAPTAAAPPPVEYPIAAETGGEPLPELADSDAPLLKALSEALGKQWLTLLLPDEIIHRFVATVDNLPRRQLPAAIVPFKRVAGAFKVTGTDETLAIAADNAARYLPYVKLVRSLDAAKLVAVYRKFYPLFERAYVDLGYPQGHFNNRLVAAIDDLLATPDVSEALAMTRPKVLDQVAPTRPTVFYEFADDELAKRSSGQKILLRIGHDNAAAIKAKLREIRELVVHG
jgi:hypothetical protein